jgi:succinyldiaminopimelate transaminase
MLAAGHRGDAMTPQLPARQWDAIKPQLRTALAHPDGVVALSLGTPVDDVPAVIRAGLAAGAGIPGYPPTHGTPELRAAIVAALERRFGITGLDESAVLPAIGSKEIVAALPRLLGLGPGDTVVIPHLAYPTYEVGAWLAGAELVRARGPGPVTSSRGKTLVWVNSPSNPAGRVHSIGEMRALVAAVRAEGAVLASDECYLAFGWEEQPVSVLHPGVCDGDHTGLLAVHSFSKTSNLAGYRAGFVAGDPALIDRMLEIRRHSGLIVPWPVQYAMAAASADDAHVAEQRQRYRARRAALTPALRAAGFRIDDSSAGLYLWATEGDDAMKTATRLAEQGILVSPGTLYGADGHQHVRVALTASDERIGAAVARLAAIS